MNLAIEAIRLQLLRCLPRRLVFHTRAKGFDTFRIVGEGPTHWIFLPRELLLSMDLSSLEATTADPALAAQLCAASDSKRVCVLRMDVREVGEDFPN